MKKQSGFTLIELVIVIIILGVLSATAIPKILNLQDDAREGAMEGLKAALETGATLTYSLAAIENIEDRYSAATSTGINIKYGYPQAVQKYLKLVIDINTDDWELTSESSSVIFTLEADSDGMDEDDIAADASICKLTYTESAYNHTTKTGDRPVITISDCTD